MEKPWNELRKGCCHPWVPLPQLQAKGVAWGLLNAKIDYSISKCLTACTDARLPAPMPKAKQSRGASTPNSPNPAQLSGTRGHPNPPGHRSTRASRTPTPRLVHLPRHLCGRHVLGRPPSDWRCRHTPPPPRAKTAGDAGILMRPTYFYSAGAGPPSQPLNFMR